ncbi:MAG: sulfatase [Candidatus Binatia bacterium]|nr:sulfatase [Candidatus Binatia bacterium]
MSTATHPKAPRGLALAATVFVLLGLGACTEAPSPAAAPSTEIDRVVRRLEAAAFPGTPTPLHGPVAQIGDEARPVVLAPEEILVAEAFGVVPKDGRAEVEIELRPEVAELSDTDFILTAQELPFTQALAEEVMAKIARENFSLRRDRGWRLRRSEDRTAATLDLDHDTNEETSVQLNLHLTALLPVPELLESDSFDVPPGARMRFGFGLTGSAKIRGGKAVEFVATLLCDGMQAKELVRRSVSLSVDSAATWQDADVALEAPGRACRLRLENRADGEPPRGAVWAVPQILISTKVAPAEDTNLILISLDTLRSDHLSGLGYGRDTSPIIDAELIAKGTTFTDTSSTFPQTDISHLSIFTGLYPSAQPKRGRVSPSDRVVLLAELLQKAGLETAAYTEDALVSGAFGFWFGFDQFTERSFAHADRGRRTIEDGIRYLEENRGSRFFLFLHTYKTHDPYVPGPDYEALWSDDAAWSDGGPAPWVPEKHREILDRYDRTIREADDLVGRVLDALERFGLQERTFVIVTSDHGEAFGEHGIAGHGFTPHQEALDVPLILRGPGIPAGKRIDTPVSIADLTPTLLDLLSAPQTNQAQGLSLVPALDGESLDAGRPLFFSWLRPNAYGVRTKNRKYHRTKQGHEQFDLAADPFEWKPDRSEDARTTGEKLLAAHEEENARLRKALGPAQNDDGPRSAPAIDERLEKSLEALGYL